MSRPTQPGGTDPIPTREWIKGVVFVAIVLAIFLLVLWAVVIAPRAG